MESTAAPQLIQNIDDHALNKLDENHKLFKQFINKKLTKVDDVYPNGVLYTIGRKYFVLDLKKERIVYYMQWEERKIFNHKAAYQVLVWSDATVPEIKGFALGVFFDILLSENDLVVTDRLQTHLGKRFWEMSITKALRESLYVYALDLNQNTKKRIYNVDELKSDIYKEYWSFEPVGRAKLMAISGKSLGWD